MHVHVYVNTNWLLDDKACGIMLIMKEKKTSSDLSRAGALLASKGAAKGGAARAANLTPDSRRAIARKAIQTRWDRYRLARGTENPARGDKLHLVADLGWSRQQAGEVRASLLAFEDDWNAPGMEEYDRL